MRIEYELAIEHIQLLSVLRSYDPIVIGTPPLGLAVEDSDIDVACSSPDLEQFAKRVVGEYGTKSNFQMQQERLHNQESVVVQFTASGWDFELFCQALPTNQQWGVRHFRIEQRLLALSQSLRPKVLELKRAGLKTEPAFAQAIGLSGDPYEAILKLENLDDDELALLVANL